MLPTSDQVVALFTAIPKGLAKLTRIIGTHKCFRHVVYRPNLNRRVKTRVINKIYIYFALDHSWYVRPAYSVRHIMVVDDVPSAAAMITWKWKHYSVNILRWQRSASATSWSLGINYQLISYCKFQYITEQSRFIGICTLVTIHIYIYTCNCGRVMLCATVIQCPTEEIALCR